MSHLKELFIAELEKDPILVFAQLAEACLHLGIYARSDEQVTLFPLSSTKKTHKVLFYYKWERLIKKQIKSYMEYGR